MLRRFNPISAKSMTAWIFCGGVVLFSGLAHADEPNETASLFAKLSAMTDEQTLDWAEAFIQQQWPHSTVRRGEFGKATISRQKRLVEIRLEFSSPLFIPRGKRAAAMFTLSVAQGSGKPTSDWRILSNVTDEGDDPFSYVYGSQIGERAFESTTMPAQVLERLRVLNDARPRLRLTSRASVTVLERAEYWLIALYDLDVDTKTGCPHAVYETYQLPRAGTKLVKHTRRDADPGCDI